MNLEKYYKILEAREKLDMKASKLIRKQPDSVNKRKHQMRGFLGRRNYLNNQARKAFEEYES